MNCELQAPYSPWKRDLRPYVFELASAIAWLLTGVTNLTTPATLVHSAVGRNVGLIAVIWSAMFVAGSLAMLLGIARTLPAVRVAGLVLLATGLMMNAIAAVSFDLTPKAVAPVVYALAATTRIWMLVVMIRQANHADAER